MNIVKGRITRILLTLGLLGPVTGDGIAADSTVVGSAAPTLKVVQHLYRQLCREIIKESGIQPGDTVVLTILRPADGWPVSSAITELLHENQVVVHVRSGEETRIPLDLRIENADFSVRYGEGEGRGIFTMGKIVRTVSAMVSARTLHTLDGRIVYGATTTAATTDTVRYDDLDLLEDPAVPRTIGKRPDGPVFERFVEPLVIIGATGIIVYLLFTVRS